MPCGSLGGIELVTISKFCFAAPLLKDRPLIHLTMEINHLYEKQGQRCISVCSGLAPILKPTDIIIIFLDDPKSSVDDTFPRRYGTVRSTASCLCSSLHPPMLPSSLPRRKEKSILVDNLAVPVDGTDNDDVGSRRRSNPIHPIPNQP